MHPTEDRGFRRHGFTVRDLLDPSVLAATLEVVESLGLSSDHPFYASVAHDWGAKAASTNVRLLPLVQPAVERALPGHEVVFAAVTSKGSGDGTDVKFHMDWTYTDERRIRAVLLWCPLVDAGPGNGGLAVLPGSHRWTRGIRAGRGMTRPPLTERDQKRISEHSVPTEVRAGQAMVFDPALLHGSPPNRSASPRPAVTVLTVPRGSQLVHFHEDDDGTVRGAEVDTDFFIEHPYGQAPIGYRPLDPWAPVVGEDDLGAALRRPRPLQRWRSRRIVDPVG